MFGVKRKSRVVHETTDSMKRMRYWIWESQEKTTFRQYAAYTEITLQFHAIVRRIVRVTIHHDTLPNVFCWREFETATAKGDGLSRLCVEPLC